MRGLKTSRSLRTIAAGHARSCRISAAATMNSPPTGRPAIAYASHSAISPTASKARHSPKDQTLSTHSIDQCTGAGQIQISAVVDTIAVVRIMAPIRAQGRALTGIARARTEAGNTSAAERVALDAECIGRIKLDSGMSSILGRA